LGGGVGLENLASLGSSQFGLPCEKIEIKAFLAERETFGKLAKSSSESFLSLGEVAFLTELMDLAGKAGIGTRTSGEGEG